MNLRVNNNYSLDDRGLEIHMANKNFKIIKFDAEQFLKKEDDIVNYLYLSIEEFNKTQNKESLIDDFEFLKSINAFSVLEQFFDNQNENYIQILFNTLNISNINNVLNKIKPNLNNMFTKFNLEPLIV